MINRIHKKIKTKAIKEYNDFAINAFGKKWGIVLISEFPKCGGTWFRFMLGQLLEDEGYSYMEEKYTVTPIKKKSIIQRHWLKYFDKTYKTIVILRDPRDAYNSFYFYENYFLMNNQRLWKFDGTADDKENLYNYLQFKLAQPKSSNPYFSYKEFWEYCKEQNNLLIVKYEDLKLNACKEMERSLDFLGIKRTPKQIQRVVNNNSLKKLKNREKIGDIKKQFFRKGIVGDWENNYSEKSKRLVIEHLGETIKEMGYHIED